MKTLELLNWQTNYNIATDIPPTDDIYDSLDCLDSDDDFRTACQTSVTVTNSRFQDYTHSLTHPEDHTQPTDDKTARFKPFTM